MKMSHHVLNDVLCLMVEIKVLLYTCNVYIYIIYFIFTLFLLSVWPKMNQIKAKIKRNEGAGN